MLRRFHKWMLYHVQWWVYTRHDVSEIALRHMRRASALQHREAMRAKMNMATYEVARWQQQAQHWSDEYQKADAAVRTLTQEEN